MLANLLRRYFKDGDEAAMDALVRATRSRLLAVARRIGARHDAEDSTQAAYYALLRHGSFREPVNVEAWLTTTVIRIAYRRKALALREIQIAQRLAHMHADIDPHAVAVHREESFLLRCSVAQLPSRYRDVMVLRHLEGLSVDETARLLGVPASTVKTRTRRGMGLLRSRLGPRIAGSLMIGPWFTLDLIGSTAKWKGALMSAKTTLVAGAVLAAAVVGVGLGINLSIPPSTQRFSSENRVQQASLPGAVQDTRNPRVGEPKAALVVATDQPDPDRAEPLTRDAHRLGVSEAALEAAKEAYDAARQQRSIRQQRSKGTEKLAALEAFGAEGFLAVLVLLRADREPTHFYWRLFGRTWEQGLERHLMELAGDREVGIEQRAHALLALGGSGIDTPEAREFLLVELERRSEPKLFAACAKALGYLREERAIPSLERQLDQADAQRSIAIIGALGTIATESSRDVLVRFAYGDRPEVVLASVVKVLGWSDEKTASKVATQILHDRGEWISESHRRTLEAAAAR